MAAQVKPKIMAEDGYEPYGEIINQVPDQEVQRILRNILEIVRTSNERANAIQNQLAAIPHGVMDDSLDLHPDLVTAGKTRKLVDGKTHFELTQDRNSDLLISVHTQIGTILNSIPILRKLFGGQLKTRTDSIGVRRDRVNGLIYLVKYRIATSPLISDNELLATAKAQTVDPRNPFAKSDISIGPATTILKPDGDSHQIIPLEAIGLGTALEGKTILDLLTDLQVRIKAAALHHGIEIPTTTA